MYNKFCADEIQQLIGYSFNNVELLKQAFTHASAGANNYERLEFLGDSYLNYYTAHKLFTEKIIPASEMTVMRSRMVSLLPLSNIIESLGLHKYIICCDYSDVIEAKGRRQNKTKSDIFESLLGAILIDGGEAAAKDFLQRFLTDVGTSRQVKDSRTLFKEMYLDRLKAEVDYVFTESDGGFSVEIVVDGNPIAVGEGRTKNQAKENACKAALAKKR